MKVALRVWRQRGPREPGRFVHYTVDDVRPETTLLEALDRLNEGLAAAGEPPVAFDSDCREGVCGACGLLVNGRPHGPVPGATTCLLALRAFPAARTITVEPFRTFPLVRDLVVDRGALDRIVRAGGYVSVRAGSAPEANTVPVPREAAERALDAAACIGCGACVAACPNGSASLFTGAKLAHLGLLPQGQPEQPRRARALVAAADREAFGGCTLHGECTTACPKRIDLGVIAGMNREYLRAELSRWWSGESASEAREPEGGGAGRGGGMPADETPAQR